MSPAPPHPPRAPWAPLAPRALPRGPGAPSSASFPPRGAGDPCTPRVPLSVILQPGPPSGGARGRGPADEHPHPPEGLRGPRERGHGELVPGRVWREVAGEGAQPPGAPPGTCPPRRPAPSAARREGPAAGPGGPGGSGDPARPRPRLPVLCQQDLERGRLGPGCPLMGVGGHLGRQPELRELLPSGLEGTRMVAQMESCSPWDQSRN